MHSTTKVTRSNRVRRSFVLVLLMATLGVVVQGQAPTMAPSMAGPEQIEPTMAPMMEGPQEPSMAPMEGPPPDMSDAPASEPPASEPPASSPVADPGTGAPTGVTEAPVTEAPSVPATTDAPTAAPVTEAPTVPATTDAPTAAPVETELPTAVPTIAPSAAPTVATPQPTGAPTLTPTQGTEAPTASPTPAPSAVATETPGKFANLQITLTGVSTLDDSAMDVWQDETAAFYTQFYEDNTQYGISNLVSTVMVVKQASSQSRRRGLNGSRNLQNQELLITYDQTIAYAIAPDSSFSPEQVITTPFASSAGREDYVNQLRNSDDAAFADITDVSQVTQEQGGGSDKNTVGNSDLTLGAVIGIAIGGFAGLVLLCGLAYMCMKRGDGGYEKSSEMHPPSTLNLGGGDDVSTLNDPKKSARDSVGGYGDQSVATVDYDYSKAYGGGADASVVSSVGGTLGSQTQATGAGTAMVEGAYSEDASFDAHYQDPNATVKEVALEVWAPPGKLGVVIDTPNDGAPVVHAIKDSSVIADKLQVGDRLIAVDDEDVQSMTAIKVSKLISRKSANATRKLSIIRQVVE